MSTDTRQLILDKSEVLVRSVGYAAFSYGDLAVDMGITKASVHYHFPAKEDLLHAILGRCIERGQEARAEISRGHMDAGARLRAYAEIFLTGIRSGMLPVCGALAAERVTLPPSAHPLLLRYFQDQIDWLTETVTAGIAQGILAPPHPPEIAAMVLFSAIEGGTLIARGMDRASVALIAFEAALQCMESPAAVGKRQRQPAPRKRATTARSEV